MPFPSPLSALSGAAVVAAGVVVVAVLVVVVVGGAEAQATKAKRVSEGERVSE